MAAKGYFDDKISDGKCEGDKYYDASDEKGGSLRSYEDGGKDCNDQIAVDILKVSYSPSKIAPINSELSLSIKFNASRDIIAGYWSIKLLVDSAYHRIIKILGETTPEDYPDGESDMEFFIQTIDVSDIEQSKLTNSGLLIASLFVDGEETISVNMVVNVFQGNDGTIMREILNPLE